MNSVPSILDPPSVEQQEWFAAAEILMKTHAATSRTSCGGITLGYVVSADEGEGPYWAVVCAVSEDDLLEAQGVLDTVLEEYDHTTWPTLEEAKSALEAPLMKAYFYIQ